MTSISVIMSVYNEPIEWISQSIDSILHQTFKDFEFIIVLDNPHGIEQKNILLAYKNKDERIKLIFNEKNLGLAHSLNIAIENSNGQFIARMDADDISHPDRLRVQYEFLLKHPEISICGTWAKCFGEIPFFSYKSYKTPVTVEQVIINSYFSSPLVHPSIMGRCKIFKENKYNIDLRKAQDYDLWCRLLIKSYRICNIPRYLFKYRITLKSRTLNVISSQQLVANIVRNTLLKKLSMDINEEDLNIHNMICTNKSITDKKIVEVWLQKIHKILINSYPNESLFINKLVNDIWLGFCLLNNISIKDYYSSSLFYRISIINVLRILKYKVLK